MEEARAAAEPTRSKQFQFVHDLRQVRARICPCAAVSFASAANTNAAVENEILMSDMSPSAKRTVVLALKWIAFTSTIALDALILLQYFANAQIANMQNVTPSKYAHRFTCGNVAVLLLELLICSFHIPPGVNGTVEISQFHSHITASTEKCPSNEVYDLVRRGNGCYLVYSYRTEAFACSCEMFARSSSTLYSQWVAFVGALNDVNAMRPFFHFKALFKIKPLHLLVPLTLLNTFLTAAIIRILENPVQASFENYWKSVWLTAVTLSATGFGDYFPVTYLGRAFTTVSAMFGGLVLVALIQSLFFGVLELSPKEHKVKHLIDMDRWEKETHRNAALLLQSAWRWYRDKSVWKAQRRLFDLMRDSRNLRSTRPIMSQSVEDHLADMEDVVLHQIDRMEHEKAQLLQRIQEKATRLGALKQTLENRRQRES
ncbi:hypothetical protein FI667_g3012, partial [Globisporangium splendens]